MTSTSDSARPRDPGPRPPLPDRWSAEAPQVEDVAALTALLRRHEEAARGWAGSTEDDVEVRVSPQGYRTREHVVLREDDGTGDGSVRGWASAHDRAAGRMLLDVVVDPALPRDSADAVAAWLFGWAEEAAVRVGHQRGLAVQQIDSGAFADDARQQAWLVAAGFEHVRTWWQMSRDVEPGPVEADARSGVRIRRVRREGDGLPEAEDLRTVHTVLESAFEDHFNSHEETYEEFLFRLREDPGHRWDHWWLAELVDGDRPEPAGALVGSVTEGEDGEPSASYVEYIGVLGSARGRGVAKSLLATVLADAAARGRESVGLEVDADSPTGADGLYVSMGWQTRYVTQSWHRDVPVEQ